MDAVPVVAPLPLVVKHLFPVPALSLPHIFHPPVQQVAPPVFEAALIAVPAKPPPAQKWRASRGILGRTVRRREAVLQRGQVEEMLCQGNGGGMPMVLLTLAGREFSCGAIDVRIAAAGHAVAILDLGDGVRAFGGWGRGAIQAGIAAGQIPVESGQRLGLVPQVTGVQLQVAGIVTMVPPLLLRAVDGQVADRRHTAARLGSCCEN